MKVVKMRRCKTCYKHQCTCHKVTDASHQNQQPKHPEDLFGSPFHCKKQKETPRFTSPNSPLSTDELDQLQACIEEINDLLRSLGSESDPNNTRQLQLHFLRLRGEIVKAQILYGVDNVDEDEEEQFELLENDHCKLLNKIGRLATAGRDFLQLNGVGSTTFILYDHLLSVTREHKCDDDEDIAEFHDATQETRRQLAFNFGEFVGKNPDLINLFFGISLHRFLKKYVGKDVKIKMPNRRITGLLLATDEEKVTIANHMGEIEIDLKDIFYIEVIGIK